MSDLTITNVLRPLRHRLVISTLLQLALVAVSYWVAASLSLNLALVNGQVTPIWPPTGIALVAILVFGRRAALGVFLAALAVNLPIGPSPAGAALIAVGNTLAPLVAAEMLKIVGFHLALDRLRDAAAIIGLGALGGMSISASVGAAVLTLSGKVPAHDFWTTWAVWWTGDAMGVLLVAPFLLSLLRAARAPSLSLRRALELTLLLIGVGLVTFVLFQNQLRLEYLVFPLIMVSAWRFQLQGAAPAALIASGVAVVSAVNGTGPFATESVVEKMITLQVFNVCVTLTSFVLASFVATRAREEETRRLYVSATAASQVKSSFLNMAAHELRTPITVLAGYLSMLADGSLGPAPDRWSKTVGILMAKTRELDRIAEDLLDAARLEASSAPATREVVDLRRIVEAAAERAGPRTELLKGTIETTLAEGPVLVSADASQLGRVLDNLINNGLSYTQRAPSLRVGCRVESGRAVVWVEDNGVGIPEASREKIFESFYRSTDPVVTKVPGVGLGLYISRQLAAQHGATLVVEQSTPGTGTVFALSLPLASPID